MKEIFNKNFSRLLLGFLSIVLVGVLGMFAIGYYEISQGGDASEPDAPDNWVDSV